MVGAHAAAYDAITSTYN